jgi:hypothetical protein
LGLEPFEWQREVLNPAARRIIMLGCRQPGKSTITAIKTLCKAKSTAGSLSLITCPAKDQSEEVMHKIDGFIAQDDRLPMLVHDGVFKKEWVTRSRILALPGTERSVRGYSKPQTIIVDEAAQVEDRTIFALRPMMIGGDCELIVLSTPRGKRGYFYRQWSKGHGWKKILVRVPWDLVSGRLVAAKPEKQFHAEMLKQGILAYYSPRHAGEEGLAFLEEELANIDELWFRQEYLCEFIDELTGIFSSELVDSAIVSTVKPLALDGLSSKIEPLEAPK